MQGCDILKGREGTAVMMPVNLHATENAKKLLKYLSEIGGQRIITGQHTKTVAMEEIAEIKRLTGKTPALRGFELLAYSPNIRYETADEECLKEVAENKNTLEEALAFGKTGGIVTFTWHWFSPLGGRDKSFYAENTDFDATLVLQEGTAEREAFFHDLDRIAELLKPFLAEDIPILWRPFHEAEGNWFWWGVKGPAVAAQLYRLQFDYFVNKYHLDNLLWVWNSPLPEGYPGDDVVDVISRDVYMPAGTATDYRKEYKELTAITAAKKPVALAEIGILPDMDLLQESRVPWCYYMTWCGEFVLTEKYNSRAALKQLYDSDYAVTFERL
ncbi:MAG: glycosyl hydrolase [Lachnospiraceae bacterium]|nr:glycosyl hydrolase [Lachnospiraceae bacterium]